MVDDIASDSDSTSTTNDSEASDKCKSPLVVPGKADTQMVDKTISDTTYQKMFQIMEKWINKEERDNKVLK